MLFYIACFIATLQVKLLYPPTIWQGLLLLSARVCAAKLQSCTTAEHFECMHKNCMRSSHTPIPQAMKKWSWRARLSNIFNHGVLITCKISSAESRTGKSSGRLFVGNLSAKKQANRQVFRDPI